MTDFDEVTCTWKVQQGTVHLVISGLGLRKDYFALDTNQAKEFGIPLMNRFPHRCWVTDDYNNVIWYQEKHFGPMQLVTMENVQQLIDYDHDLIEHLRAIQRERAYQAMLAKRRAKRAEAKKKKET